eukprot:24455-Chlamydomonas_euryale.AAC.2
MRATGCALTCAQAVHAAHRRSMQPTGGPCSPQAVHAAHAGGPGSPCRPGSHAVHEDYATHAAHATRHAMRPCGSACAQASHKAQPMQPMRPGIPRSATHARPTLRCQDQDQQDRQQRQQAGSAAAPAVLGTRPSSRCCRCHAAAPSFTKLSRRCLQSARPQGFAPACHNKRVDGSQHQQNVFRTTLCEWRGKAGARPQTEPPRKRTALRGATGVEECEGVKGVPVSRSTGGGVAAS